MTKLELCARIKAKIPDFEYIPAQFAADPDKRNYYVSNAKLEALGYRPDYTIDDGIVELIKAYQIINNKKYGNY